MKISLIRQYLQIWAESFHEEEFVRLALQKLLEIPTIYLVGI
jgi:hypothetical protein